MTKCREIAGPWENQILRSNSCHPLITGYETIAGSQRKAALSYSSYVQDTALNKGYSLKDGFTVFSSCISVVCTVKMVDYFAIYCANYTETKREQKCSYCKTDVTFRRFIRFYYYKNKTIYSSVNHKYLFKTWKSRNLII